MRTKVLILLYNWCIRLCNEKKYQYTFYWLVCFFVVHHTYEGLGLLCLTGKNSAAHAKAIQTYVAPSLKFV
jgi:hypothetical protein